jgi:hypothetical protein
MDTPRLVIYGFGNLGHHLLKLFWGRGMRSISIVTNQNLHGDFVEGYFSYNEVQKEPKYRIKLGEDVPLFSRDTFCENSSVSSDESIIFLCVNDDKIEKTLLELENYHFNSQRVILSGGYQFKDGIPSRVSVVYPLYSFSQNTDIDWNRVPIFLESPNQSILDLLKELNLPQVTQLSSEQRNILHIAAVFANNFTNAMFIAAQEILEITPELKMDFLLPIIEQTIEKLHNSQAIDNQTGPAKRGDVLTIERHKQLLSNLESERILYESITKYIRAKLNLM